MKVKEITYERLVPTYPYANVRVGLTAEFTEDEDLMSAAELLIQAVTEICRREIARIDPFYKLPEDERAEAAARRALPGGAGDSYPPEPLME